MEQSCSVQKLYSKRYMASTLLFSWLTCGNLTLGETDDKHVANVTQSLQCYRLHRHLHVFDLIRSINDAFLRAYLR